MITSGIKPTGKTVELEKDKFILGSNSYIKVLLFLPNKHPVKEMPAI